MACYISSDKFKILLGKKDFNSLLELQEAVDNFKPDYYKIQESGGIFSRKIDSIDLASGTLVSGDLSYSIDTVLGISDIKSDGRYQTLYSLKDYNTRYQKVSKSGTLDEVNELIKDLEWAVGLNDSIATQDFKDQLDNMLVELRKIRNTKLDALAQQELTDELNWETFDQLPFKLTGTQAGVVSISIKHVGLSDLDKQKAFRFLNILNEKLGGDFTGKANGQFLKFNLYKKGSEVDKIFVEEYNKTSNLKEALINTVKRVESTNQKQNKPISEEINKKKKEITRLEVKIFVEKNNGKKVKINGFEGSLTIINENRVEVENNNSIKEFLLDEIESYELIEKEQEVKESKLKSKYSVTNISETEVTVNGVEYSINVDSNGNIKSLSPTNKPNQELKNNELIIAVEIERNKLEIKNQNVSENSSVSEQLKEGGHERIDWLLEEIYNTNYTETIDNALDALYNDKKLTASEKLQVGIWLQDAFDRLSTLFNNNNTPLERETLLNAYDNLEIILSLLYDKQLKSTTKAQKNEKESNVGKTEVANTAQESKKQSESKLKPEPETITNTSDVEKLESDLAKLKEDLNWVFEVTRNEPDVIDEQDSIEEPGLTQEEQANVDTWDDFVRETSAEIIEPVQEPEVVPEDKQDIPEQPDSSDIVPPAIPPIDINGMEEADDTLRYEMDHNANNSFNKTSVSDLDVKGTFRGIKESKKNSYEFKLKKHLEGKTHGYELVVVDGLDYLEEGGKSIRHDVSDEVAVKIKEDYKDKKSYTLVLSKDGKPVKLNDKFEESQDGKYVTFNFVHKESKEYKNQLENKLKVLAAQMAKMKMPFDQSIARQDLESQANELMTLGSTYQFSVSEGNVTHKWEGDKRVYSNVPVTVIDANYEIDVPEGTDTFGPFKDSKKQGIVGATYLVVDGKHLLMYPQKSGNFISKILDKIKDKVYTEEPVNIKKLLEAGINNFTYSSSYHFYVNIQKVDGGFKLVPTIVGRSNEKVRETDWSKVKQILESDKTLFNFNPKVESFNWFDENLNPVLVKKETYKKLYLQNVKMSVEWDGIKPLMSNQYLALNKTESQNTEIPVEETKPAKVPKKKFDVTDLDGLDASIESYLNDNPISQEDHDWAKETFGDNTPNVIIVANLSNEAKGRFTQSALYLTEKAGTRVFYHEHWHNFSQLFLTKAQKLNLYKEVRSRKGTGTVWVGGKEITKPFKNMSNLEAEEILAYEFGSFMKGEYTVHQNVFQKIWNFIKNWIFNKPNQAYLFNRLKNKNITRFEYNTSNPLFNILNADFIDKGKVVFTEDQIPEVLRALDSVFFNVIEILNQREVMAGNNKIPMSRIFTKNNLSKVLGNMEKVLKLKYNALEDENQQAELEYLIDNYTPELVEFWKANTTLPTKDYFKDLEIDEDKSTGDVASLLNGNEESSLEAASKETKLVVMSLPQLDGFGNEIKDKYGLTKRVEFLKAWNRITSLVEGTTSYTELYNKIDALSKPETPFSNPIFQSLLNNIPAPKDLVGKTDEITLLNLSFATKLEQDLGRAYVGQINVFYDKKNGNIKLDEGSKNNLQQLKQIVRAQFLDNLQNRELTYQVGDTTGKVFLFDEEDAGYLSSKFILDLYDSLLRKDASNVKIGNETFTNIKDLEIKLLEVFGLKLSGKAIEDYKSQSLYSDAFRRIIGIYEKSKTARGLYHYALLNRQYAESRRSLLEMISQGSEDEKIQAYEALDNLKKITLYDPFLKTSKEFEWEIGQSNVKLQSENSGINALLNLESKYSDIIPTSTVRNANGDLVYALQLQNFYTTVISKLNQIKNLDEIKGTSIEHLHPDNNFNVKNSWLLPKLFGNNKAKIKMYDTSGMIIQESGKTLDENLSTDLDERAKTIQNYILLHRNKLKLARPGDKSREPHIEIEGLEVPVKGGLSINGQLNPQIWEIYSGYIFDDFTRIQKFLDPNFIGHRLDGLAKNRGATDFITLGDQLTSETDLDKFIKDNEASLKQSVIDYFQDQIDQEQISLKQLSLDIDLNWYSKMGMKFDELVEHYVVNQTILWVESAKLFNGDLAFYGDYYKRNSNILSTGKMLTDDQNILDSLNKMDNTNLGEAIFRIKENAPEKLDSLLEARKVNKSLIKDLLKKESITQEIYNERLANIESLFLQGIKDLSKEYGKSEVKNKYSVAITQAAKRDSSYLDLIRKSVMDSLDSDPRMKLTQQEKESMADNITQGYRGIDTADAQGAVTLDFYRTMKILGGNWFAEHEAVYVKAVMGEKLSREELFYFMPVKPQYAGFIPDNEMMDQGVSAPAFDKTAFFPLLPSVIKGTYWEQINEQLHKQDIGYLLFSSGSKLVVKKDKNGNMDKFYKDNQSKSPIDKTFQFEKQARYFKYLKEQVNIAPELHDHVKFPTQLRKIFFLDNHDKGVVQIPELDKFYQEYKTAIKNLLNQLETELLEGLDITKQGTIEFAGTTIPNYVLGKDSFNKLTELVQSELSRREVPENVREFFITENGQPKYPLDSSLSRQVIQTIINSLVDRRLVRQLAVGDMMVQVSSTGFEKMGVETSKDLKFYRIENGEVLPAEIKVPINDVRFGKTWTNLLKLEYEPGKKIGSINKLNALIREKGDWYNKNKELLRTVAVRIPTQSLNSVEYFEVQEFLSPEAGNMVVVPQELPAKSGGDFDVDKLTFLKRAFNPDKAEEFQNQILDTLIGAIKLPGRYHQLVQPNSTSLWEDYIGKYDPKNPDGKIEQTTIEKRPGKPIPPKPQGSQVVTVGAEKAKFKGGLGGKKGVGVTANMVTFTQLAIAANLKFEFTSKFHDTPWDGLVPLKNEEGVFLSQFNEQAVNTQVDALNNPIAANSNVTNENLGTLLVMDLTGLGHGKIFEILNQPLIALHSQNKVLGKSQSYGEVNMRYGDEKIQYKVSKPSTGSKLVYDLLFNSKVRADIGIGNIGKQLFEEMISRAGIKEFTYSEDKTITISKVLDMISEDGIPSKSFKIKWLYETLKLLNEKSKIDTSNLSETRKKNFWHLTNSEIIDQIVMLAHYQEWEQLAQATRTLQSSINFDVRTTQNPIEAYAKMLEFGEAMGTGFFDYESSLRLYNDSVISPFKVQPLKLALFNKYMPVLNTPEFVRAVKNFSGYVGDYDLRESFYRTYPNDFLQFIFQNFAEENGENITKKYLRDLFTNPSTFKDVTKFSEEEFNQTSNFAHELMGFIKKQKSQNKSNYFLDNLIVGTENGAWTIKLNRMSNSNLEVDAFVRGFKEFNNINPEMAKRLAIFEILQSGWNKSNISFTEVIPTELYIDLVESGINNYMAHPNKEKLVTDFFNRSIRQNNKFFKNSKSIVGYLESQQLDTTGFDQPLFRFPSYAHKFYYVDKQTKQNLPDMEDRDVETSTVEFSESSPMVFNTTSGQLIYNDGTYRYYTTQDLEEMFEQPLSEIKQNNPLLFSGEQVYVKFNPTGTLERKSSTNNTTVDKSMSWARLKDLPIISNKGVMVMRKQGTNEHFGNPFTGSGVQGLIQMPNVASAVLAYKNWLKGDSVTEDTNGKMYNIDKVNPKQREWIVSQINQGKLDNQTLLYMNDKGEYYSHADALAEIVNNKSTGTLEREVVQSTPNKTYSGLITNLENNQVFVFGSNPVGINGNPDKGTGGSALVATNKGWVKQSEKMNNRLSDSGKAWGLTTVTYPGKKRSMSASQITEGIKKLYDYAFQNPDKEFLVAYTGTGTNLNGYSNKELADIFSSLPIPNNIVFEEQFATLLGNQQDSNLDDLSSKIERLKENANYIKLTEDESQYINTKTGKVYTRVTTFTKDEEVKATPLMQTAAAIGNKVDILIRDFFDGVLKPLSEYDVSRLSELEQFVEDLTKIKEKMDAREESVVSRNIVVYSDRYGIAGTVDLLTVDSNQKVRLYDVKTMRGNNFTEKYSGHELNKWETKEFGKSKKQQYQEQLSLYAILLEDQNGITVDSLGILPIAIQYNIGDTSTQRLDMLKGIQLEKLDSVKNVGKVDNIDDLSDPTACK